MRRTASVQRPASTQPTRRPGAKVFENEPHSMTWPPVSNERTARRLSSCSARSLCSTSSIIAMPRAATMRASRLRSAVGRLPPSGLDSVGEISSALTGCVASASSSASSDRPSRGCVGISRARRCRLCRISRKPKYVGDSSATMSPGWVTARRHSVIDSRQLLVATMSRGFSWQPRRSA